MINRTFLIISILLSVISFANTTNAELIGFEDIAVEPGENDRAGDRTSSDFLFDSSSDHTHLINALLGADNGTTYLALDDHYGHTVLTITNLYNYSFSLSSIDIGEWSAKANDNATSVRVIAYTNSNEQYSVILNLDGIFDGIGPQADFETFTFDNWNDLNKIDIVGHGGFRGGAFAIDNLVMPEPGTLILALCSSMIFLRRRK